MFPGVYEIFVICRKDLAVGEHPEGTVLYYSVRGTWHIDHRLKHIRKLYNEKDAKQVLKEELDNDPRFYIEEYDWTKP